MSNKGTKDVCVESEIKSKTKEIIIIIIIKKKKRSFSIPEYKALEGRTSQDVCRVFSAGVSDWHDTRQTGVTAGGTNPLTQTGGHRYLRHGTTRNVNTSSGIR